MTGRATMAFLFVAFFIITTLLCWVAGERGFKRGAKYGAAYANCMAERHNKAIDPETDNGEDASICRFQAKEK